MTGRVLPTAETRPFDRRALGAMVVAGAVATVVGLSSVVELLDYSAIASLDGITGTASGTEVSAAGLVPLGALLGASILLVVVEAFLFRSVFRGLSYFDRGFARPASLSLLAVLGVILSGFGTALLIGELAAEASCAGPGNPVPASCISVGVGLVGLLLAGVGAIVFLVGFLGIMLGVWRVGRRYRSVLIRCGAVTMILPFANALGGLLLIVGTVRARRRLESP